MQRMEQMAEAAASAAQAAEHAINVMQAASNSSSSGGGAVGTWQTCLSTASRVLRNPGVFDGTGPHAFVTWKFIFISWLTFAEPQYQQLLEKVEQMDRLATMSEYTEDVKQLSTRLFSILTSYLRGRCLQLVRSDVDTRDGFRLWKVMHREYLPSSRARSLALAQALPAYPSISKEKTVMESVLNYEQLVHELEKISGTTYPAELKSATLVRCSENRLREHLQLTIKDSRTYAEIPEAVFPHEQTSRTWSAETIMKSLTLKPNDARDEAIPMDVDRMEKGKGKGKQKGKEKGKGWWSGFPYGGGRGYPKGKGRGFGRGGKSKGKQKGKKGGKSKGKDKGKNGGKKGGNIDQNQCVASGGVSTASTLNTAVRRIFDIVPPSSIAGSIDSSVRVIIQDLSEECAVETCRSVVILDSGSGFSLLPLSYATEKAKHSNVRLQDCQGSQLKTVGLQEATLVAYDSNTGEEIELRHNFVVGNVNNCILSL